MPGASTWPFCNFEHALFISGIHFGHFVPGQFFYKWQGHVTPSCKEPIGQHLRELTSFCFFQFFKSLEKCAFDQGMNRNDRDSLKFTHKKGSSVTDFRLQLWAVGHKQELLRWVTLHATRRNITCIQGRACDPCATPAPDFLIAGVPGEI